METSFNGLHYNSIASLLKNEFGTRIIKLPIDGGFTCPNRDGRVSTGGCSFCTTEGAGEFACKESSDIKNKMESESKKWGDDHKYLAYFQSFTNTYAPAEALRNMWNEALKINGVVGLAIATRPDCLDDEILDLLSEFNDKTYLWVELGLQTSNEKTAENFNRAYPNEVFEQAMHRLHSRSIKSVVHMIMGLPGETRADMLNTGKYTASFDPFGIKIHMLNILSDSRLGQEYLKTEEQKRMQLLSKEEYIRIVCDILEIMPQSITVHRLTGDGPSDKLIAPLWVKNKHEVLNGIQQEFSKRKSYQGSKLYLSK